MKRYEIFYKANFIIKGVRGGLVVEGRTPEREVKGLIFIRVVSLSKKHLPPKSGNTKEVVATPRHD